MTRKLGIIPMAEQYILTCASSEERKLSLDFNQAREFFQRASAKDAELGIEWQPRFGTRILAEPQCRRPLYSFAVFPNGDVTDCPGGFQRYGNLREESLWQIIYSDTVKRFFRDYRLCPCSVFYTEPDEEGLVVLPPYLEGL